MEKRHYIVSIEQGKRARSVVWDATKPLPLQIPARWVLCETPRGLRLLEQSEGNARRLSVPQAAMTGSLINVPASQDLRAFGIRVRPLRRPVPVYATKKKAGMGSWADARSSEVVFCGVGEGLLTHHHVGDSFKIHVDGEMVFTHRRVGDDHEITARASGVAIHFSGESRRTILPGSSQYLTSQEWEQGVLRWNNHWWRFATIPDPKALAENIELEAAEKKEGSGLGWYAGIAGFLLSAALLLSPSMEREEIAKPKSVTEIQLKAPKIVQALPTPAPKPIPKPEIKKEVPKVAVKKPEPPKPKPAVKPQVAKIAKRTAPAKPAQAKPAPKLAARPQPKPAQAPKPVTRPLVAERPAAPAPHPIERNITKPVARATVPSISPEQIAAKQAAQVAARAKAQLAQSLNFLSTSSSRPAAAMEADLIADANQKQEAKFKGGTVSSAITKTEGTYLSSLSSQGSAEGRRIVTRSARRISADEDTAYGGDGRAAGSGQVRGKVAASSLGSGDGSGVALGAGLGGGLDVSGSGEVAEIDIEKALEKSLARFQYCYEKVLLSDASLAGTILMEWTIDSSGRGSSVKVVRSQLNNNPLHHCLSSELSRVQFPSPKGGAVIVKYPFAFSSGTM